MLLIWVTRDIVMILYVKIISEFNTLPGFPSAQGSQFGSSSGKK